MNGLKATALDGALLSVRTQTGDSISVTVGFFVPINNANIAAKDLKSSDAGNAVTLGTDSKLYVKRLVIHNSNGETIWEQ